MVKLRLAQEIIGRRRKFRTVSTLLFINVGTTMKRSFTIAALTVSLLALLAALEQADGTKQGSAPSMYTEQ